MSRVPGFVVVLLSCLATVVLADAPSPEPPGIRTDIRNLENTYKENREVIDDSYQAIRVMERYLAADLIMFRYTMPHIAPVLIPVSEKEASDLIKVRVYMDALQEGGRRPTQQQLLRELESVKQDSWQIKKGFRAEIDELHRLIDRARRANVDIDNQIAALKARQAPVQLGLTTETWQGTWTCKGPNEMTLTIGGSGEGSSIQGTHTNVRHGPTASESYDIDAIGDTSAKGRYLYKDNNPLIGPPRKDKNGKNLTEKGQPGQWPGTWEITLSGENLTLVRHDDASPWSGKYSCTRN